MIDGVLLMMTWLHGFAAAGQWRQAPGCNLLDGGSPMYNVYETADGGYLAVGALEGKFYREFLDKLGLDPAGAMSDYAPENWAAARSRIAQAVRARTRAHWSKIFADANACATPVLSPEESMRHPHQVAREAFVRVGDYMQPAPAPRFERMSTDTPKAANAVSLSETLKSFGIPQSATDLLTAQGVLTVSSAP